MMTCDEWRAFAHDYALGDLSAGGRIARHLGELADQLEDLGLALCKGIH